MIVVNNFLHFNFIFLLYCFTDKLLGNIKGKYYFVHFINNLFVSYYTIYDLYITYFKFNEVLTYQINYLPTILTFSLHLYHIFMYYNKLLFDDWLHHILMCCFALPSGLYLNCGSLLGHSLFYLTGLPGGINYLMLFLNRNNLLDRLKQKKYNTLINLWIRSPGCIIQSILSFIVFINNYHYFNNILKIICAFFGVILPFWNGIYFMNQVVSNYAVEKYKIKLLKNKD
jgi:hypothetical protein